MKLRCRSAAGRSIASDHVRLQSSRRASCLQTGQECVSVVFGRPGSRPVHSDLESELGAVGVLAPNLSPEWERSTLQVSLYVTLKADVLLHYQQISRKDQIQQHVGASQDFVASLPRLWL